MVAHGCRKRKKLICGPEEEIVVAHGRLPSPAHYTGASPNILKLQSRLKAHGSYRSMIWASGRIYQSSVILLLTNLPVPARQVNPWVWYTSPSSEPCVWWTSPSSVPWVWWTQPVKWTLGLVDQPVKWTLGLVDPARFMHTIRLAEFKKKTIKQMHHRMSKMCFYLHRTRSWI